MSDTSSKRNQRILRDAVSEGSNSGSTPISNRDRENVSQEDDSLEVLMKKAGGDNEKLLDLLKIKVVEMEDRLNSDVAKCSICMGSYIDPVVSTSCWHVCCSECWLRSLGAKKLCPKCNNIVSPSQLRKIYL